MTRRTFLCGLTLGALCAPLAAEAQKPQARVGVLSIVGSGAQQLEDALRELGWVDGRNVIIERRLAPSYDGLARYAIELAQLGVDVIVCTNAPAVRAAKSATQTIPIVMAPAGDPIAAGFVSNLARPGGNITGVAIMHTELSGKRLEFLFDAIPAAKRIAVLSNPRNPSTPPMLQETVARSRALGIETVPFEATTVDQLASRFAVMAQQRVAGLVVLGDPFFYEERRKLVSLALQHRLPAVYEWGDMAEAGGLMAYGPRRADLRRRAAEYVDRILKGAKPGDLPVEQPTKFELVINLKTAKALGLTIPPSLLLRADQVIE
jgi:putative tryptophan/tyrosine transport system substrate-binding protein